MKGVIKGAESRLEFDVGVIIKIEADSEGDCCECKMEQERVEWIA